MQLPHALIPAKTFLFGEYAVLKGAPAVIISSPPFFEVVSENFDFYHPESIAAKIINQKQTIGIRDNFKFKGLGKSSAEIIIASFDKLIESDIDIILKNHKKHCLDLKLSASGSDLISQWFGGCTEINNNLYNKSIMWPFKEFDIGIWSTSNKLATHTHLTNFNEVPIEIIECSKNCFEAWQKKDINELTRVVTIYQNKLVSLGLQTTKTTDLVIEIIKIDGVLLAKGCGAMGTDTIITLSENKAQSQIISKIEKLGLTKIFLNNFATKGLLSQIPHFRNSLNLRHNAN